MSVAMMGSGGGGKLHFLDLGINTTFDVSASYKDYKNLTVDNFVIYSVSDISDGNSCWHHIGGMKKNYDASTGKLECGVRLDCYNSANSGPSRQLYASVGIKLVY